MSILTSLRESELFNMTRFSTSNLPLSFLNEFHCIETDELKQAIVDVANLMYDDYSVEEVQEMFSTFSSTMYEVYSLFLYNRDVKNLDLIVEAMLYCASQFESYRIHQFRKSNHKRVKVLHR